jgi:phage shock protein PspC (stress-responsive transcriptional regulator)
MRGLARKALAVTVIGHDGGMSDVNGETGSSRLTRGDHSGLPVTGKRLERKVKGRVIAGVCAGTADYFGVDVTLIRVIFVVLTFFGGLGLVAYVAAWALVPEEGESASIVEKAINKTGT